VLTRAVHSGSGNRALSSFAQQAVREATCCKVADNCSYYHFIDLRHIYRRVVKVTIHPVFALVSGQHPLSSIDYCKSLSTGQLAADDKMHTATSAVHCRFQLGLKPRLHQIQTDASSKQHTRGYKWMQLVSGPHVSGVNAA